MKTSIRITSNHLTETQKERMWSIYKHFYHYPKSHFLSRIESNTHYAFYFRGQDIVGFTGLRINTIQQGRTSNLLMYFGQTIIQPAYRGNALILRTGFILIRKFWKAFFRGKVYFWADAITYKAYLVFARCLATYYPSYQSKTPETVSALIDQLGQQYYGENFNPASGTVTKSVHYVNDRSVTIHEQDLQDPDIRFYADTNQQHAKGHGLITIAPANVRNVLHMLSHFLRKQWPNRRKKLSAQPSNSRYANSAH